MLVPRLSPPPILLPPRAVEPSNSPETFPEATIFLGSVVGDNVPSKVENKMGEGAQTLQHPLRVAGGSLEQTGLPWWRPPALQAIVPVL